jgi:hypothetical protein
MDFNLEDDPNDNNDSEAPSLKQALGVIQAPGRMISRTFNGP